MFRDVIVTSRPLPKTPPVSIFLIVLCKTEKFIKTHDKVKVVSLIQRYRASSLSLGTRRLIVVFSKKKKSFGISPCKKVPPLTLLRVRLRL